MATKKTTKQEKTVVPEKKSSFAENYGSTILGFIVVLILGSFLFNVFRGNKQENGSVGSGEETQNENQPTDARIHVVVAGEDLWKISEKYYKSGYNWSDIARANNINNPNQLEEGMRLTIPVVTPAEGTEVTQAPTATETPKATETPTATVAPTQTTQQEVTKTPEPTLQPTQAPTSTSGTYTVVKGDSLWTIAVKEYNDGYKWVEIAQANNLKNPNIIHVGNQLTLPR